MCLGAAVLLVLAAHGQADESAPVSADGAVREAPFVVRPLRLMQGDRWIGEGIDYGPHRDGQRPGGTQPSAAQLLEDLRLIAARWSAVRIYGAAEIGDTLLHLIRTEHLPLSVLLGVWIGVEASLPDSQGVVTRSEAMAVANRRELEAGVRLAAAYPDIVTGLCIGSETQVPWSDHRCPPDVLIGYLREARARTRVPVTTADDFNFWNKPESNAVAREVDFIVLHAHPLWNGQPLENAVPWTKAVYADIRARHPDRLIVLGETGWATRRYTEGDQAKLMKGRLGEPEQATFLREFRKWVVADRVPSYFFEAFDENWKGGDHPDEVEKHWGLFRADRTPKQALARAR